MVRGWDPESSMIRRRIVRGELMVADGDEAR